MHKKRCKEKERIKRLFKEDSPIKQTTRGGVMKALRFAKRGSMATKIKMK
jgi:hypothetical protein